MSDVNLTDIHFHPQICLVNPIAYIISWQNAISCENHVSYHESWYMYYACTNAEAVYVAWFLGLQQFTDQQELQWSISVSYYSVSKFVQFVSIWQCCYYNPWHWLCLWLPNDRWNGRMQRLSEFKMTKRPNPMRTLVKLCYHCYSGPVSTLGSEWLTGRGLPWGPCVWWGFDSGVSVTLPHRRHRIYAEYHSPSYLQNLYHSPSSCMYLHKYIQNKYGKNFVKVKIRSNW